MATSTIHRHSTAASMAGRVSPCVSRPAFPAKQHAPLSKAGTAAPATDADAHHAGWHPHPIMAAYRDNQLKVPLALITLIVGGTLLAPDSLLGHIALPSYPIDGTEPLPRPRSAAAPGFVADGTQLYGKGAYDVAFVAFGVLVWTFLRAAVIDYVLRPTAKALGCRRALVERFGEQGWLVVYYTLSFSVGTYFVYNSPYWYNTSQFWIDYPHAYLTGPFKSYYLMQLAFWIQQLFVIHIEKPRKDHVQMLAHHLVTCALIISSYYTNFTRIGSAVLVTMDVGDILLSSAKCFNYVRWRRLCDATFVAFVGVWLYSRHYIYLSMVWSLWSELPTILPLTWAPERGHYMSTGGFWFFMTLLLALQALLLMWLYMIVRVVLKVVRGSAPEDNRSDDEASDNEDEDEDEDEQQQTAATAPPKKAKRA
ncbi:Sphingosine N-acyltransferase lag1 [Blastocladiella emersonii ATCC 22665]|nr:Sphingosine N-acyltransferase lag1 [Blastocladiella emersonii ATCC 22665]